MSLKKNILANYVSQIYVIVIGIVMVPFYIKYMGAEAYGLVGFFSMFQAWFSLLDLGLSPTMSRETARFSGGAINAKTLRSLFRILELLFFGIAVVIGVCIVVYSKDIASNWLQVRELSMDEVARAITIMGVIISLRWMSGLYRSMIIGFERQVWLGVFNVIIATARFVVIIPVLMHIGASPTVFFSFQLCVTLIEGGFIFVQTYRILPHLEMGEQIEFSWKPLKNVLRFSLSIAFGSAVWTFVTQTDKLILSKFLTLTDYAYFSVAVLVAGGVSILTSPISQALLPKLTTLSAEGNEKGFIDLYRNSTQLVCVVVAPITLTLAYFALPILAAWTGNDEISQRSAPILVLYAVGNGFLAITSFQYYLQYAKGTLRLHMIGNILLAVVLLPCLVWSTINYGVIGAGFSWLIVNCGFFLFWTPIIHSRLVKGLHWNWLLVDIAPIVLFGWLAAIASFAASHELLTLPTTRWLQAAVSMGAGFFIFSVSLMGSSFMRNRIFQILNRYSRS